MKTFRILVWVSVGMLANACSADTSATADEQASETGQSAETEFASTYNPETDFSPGVLTEAYFLGDWCLAEVLLMGMTDKPNYTYKFLPEGQLHYENDPGSDTLYGGDWRVEGDHLFIVAASLSGAQALKTVTPNEFMVDADIIHTFRRGVCK